jgi:suppressor of G2 allele of SKP1
MPSATSLAEQGLKAFNSSNYAEAITLYSDALSLNPEVPDCYLKRSVAYQRTSQHELALHDAELAVMLANRRGKRELIGSAQFRRGIALHLLGRYGDANFCFNEAAQRCSEKERNMLGMWKKKLEIALEKVDEDDLSREVTVTEIPIVNIPKKEKVLELQPGGAKVADKQHTILAQTPTPSSPDSAPTGVVTPASKIRHEWYQTSTHIVLTLYVKGVPKDRATVDITNETVCTAPCEKDLETYLNFIYSCQFLFRCRQVMILSLTSTRSSTAWSLRNALTAFYRLR